MNINLFWFFKLLLNKKIRLIIICFYCAFMSKIKHNKV